MTENTAARIAGAKAKIDKITQKLERVKTALAGGKNPYYYIESDLGRTERELAEAVAALEKWEAKAAKEEKAEAEPKIAAVEEFLERWKASAKEYYTRKLKALNDYIAEVRAKEKTLEEEFTAAGISIHSKYYEERRQELKIDYDSRRNHIQNHYDATVQELRSCGKDWEQRLEVLLEREKTAKRQNLISRVKKVIGVITDATRLYIADNGEINGFVFGTQGKAAVETITAGGYNIQCFHFRVLVKPAK